MKSVQNLQNTPTVHLSVIIDQDPFLCNNPKDLCNKCVKKVSLNRSVARK